MLPRFPTTCRLARWFRARSCAVAIMALSLAGSGHAAAASGAPAGGLAGYQIVPLGRGHLNRLRLLATIEGTKGLLELDTGASKTVLSREKFGFLLPGRDRQLPPGVPASVPVNNLSCPVGLARDFHVGNVNLGSIPVALVNGNFLYDTQMLYDPGSAQQHDGLLGENLLRHYRAIVDCGRLALYLSTDPARKLNLGPALTHAGWTRISMEDYGNDFTVPCTLRGHRFRVIVDTGAPFTILDKDRLRIVEMQAAELPVRSSLIGTHGGNIGFLKIDGFQVGDYTAAQSQAIILPGMTGVVERKQNASPSAPMLGLLGGNFLSNNNALIDVGDHALYLKHGGTAENPSP